MLLPEVVETTIFSNTNCRELEQWHHNPEYPGPLFFSYLQNFPNFEPSTACLQEDISQIVSTRVQTDISSPNRQSF